MELSSCASFLAREMVRYAEAKAIFTFIIGVDHGEQQQQQQEAVLDSSVMMPPQAQAQAQSQQQHKMCLLLRLVSWDTTIATEASKNDGGLKYENVAKVVYEEVVDEMIDNNTSKADNTTTNNKSEDPSQWVWGGVNLCCILPGVKETGTANHQLDKVSTVRLQLPLDEYEIVKKDLHAKSNLFPKSIKDATILMKMGGAMGGTSSRSSGNTTMDLTVLPLR
ncbi:unnamed protein product [Cylindrotheca closterium]|uniref:Uncharacterized protein n=1 Tax=Cylindrotheca closterium TaxID=2856 RepID=A0AAD2GE72_9STRA|nr:unnamed protein product [Cylindrotheca closterium]